MNLYRSHLRGQCEAVTNLTVNGHAFAQDIAVVLSFLFGNLTGVSQRNVLDGLGFTVTNLDASTLDFTGFTLRCFTGVVELVGRLGLDVGITRYFLRDNELAQVALVGVGDNYVYGIFRADIYRSFVTTHSVSLEVIDSHAVCSQFRSPDVVRDIFVNLGDGTD